MLSNRQKSILELVEKKRSLNAKDITLALVDNFGIVSKPTILRDLAKLLALGHIEKSGRGPNTLYLSKTKQPFLVYVDSEKYFLEPTDKRVIQERFNWDIFDKLRNIFSVTELEELKSLNDKYLARRAQLSPVALKKEFERLTIELSWKSSQLEGNTYSLIDTEILLTKLKESPGHTKEESVMILNHKQAIDFILDTPNHFKILTPVKIREVHKILMENLGVPDDYRQILVGVIGTKYKPLDNQGQVIEAVEKSCAIINGEQEPIVKALVAAILVAYIQPFVDGNKRTGRLLADALLAAGNWCPLSYRSIDEAQYKKAVLLFYEQNNLSLFKELFVEQFKFAVNNYFGM